MVVWLDQKVWMGGDLTNGRTKLMKAILPTRSSTSAYDALEGYRAPKK